MNKTCIALLLIIILLSITGTITLISGIILGYKDITKLFFKEYESWEEDKKEKGKEGKIILGLKRDEWKQIHLISAMITTVLVIIHLMQNIKPLKALFIAIKK